MDNSLKKLLSQKIIEAKSKTAMLSIDEIDTYKYGYLDEWAKEIVYRQGRDGGAEKGKEGGVNEGEEKDVMSQIYEIGRVANERWEASVS
jgi:hypothetical protein